MTCLVLSLAAYVALEAQHRANILLIEPVILPSMNHVSVDDDITAGDKCLFYPSGEKSLAMRGRFEKTVQMLNSMSGNPSETLVARRREPIHADITANDLIMRDAASHNSSSAGTRRSKKTLGCRVIPFKFDESKPKPVLAYTRRPDANIKSLIQSSRNNEHKLYSTINVRF